MSFEKGKDGSYSLTRKITKAIESLWEDQVVKEAFDNRADYQLCDSAEYFLNKFERVSSRNYLPNEKDICCVQSPTTQVNEKTYKINDAICTFVDVGGQVHERMKWINCFEDATNVIFMVDISAFDQLSTVNNNLNQLQEALNLFQILVNTSLLEDVTITLFMNKHDIFCERITTKSIRNDDKNWFTDYEGGCNEQEAFDYIKNKFLSTCQDESREIIVKRTRAIDTRGVEHTMDDLHDVL